VVGGPFLEPRLSEKCNYLITCPNPTVLMVELFGPGYDISWRMSVH
jgi:hypothetical protein